MALGILFSLSKRKENENLKKLLISQCINFYFIDDQCQYWLNKTDGTLTSPFFGKNAIGNQQRYDNNLNCTWIINADQGFYITLDIEYFEVNDNDHKLQQNNKLLFNSFFKNYFFSLFSKFQGSILL